MLAPHDRRLLFELLRPPVGYRLSDGIGTTYSLDLTALLVTPLAFTLFDLERRDGRTAASPAALLESLRRHADHLTLYCQAGQIHPPSRARALYGYLEGSIVEAAAPAETGDFHAKLWLLRFEPVDPGDPADTPILYRLLVPSRNLTFDRSWDTMLALDGTYRPGRPPRREAEPLARMIAALPGLAVRAIGDAAGRSRADRLAGELARVDFEPPEGFDGLRFWPLGLADGSPWPFGGPVERLLVVSPFLTDGMAGRLAALGPATILSRAEELAKLSPATVARFADRFTLDPAAEAEPPEAADDDPVAVEGTGTVGEEVVGPDPSRSPGEALSGLHAKVYVADRGGRGHLWTGSANATDAAFNRNVEILVELTGPVEACGVGAVLDPESGRGLRSLMQPFVAPSVGPDEAGERVERELDAAVRAIAGHGLRLVVTPSGDGDGGAGAYDLVVIATPPLPDRWTTADAVRCRPVTVRDSWARELAGMPPTARFERLAFQALTTFVAFDVTVTRDGRTGRRVFVVNLPAEGMPDDRRERLLLSLLTGRDQLMRYLMLLLADDGWEAQGTLDLLDAGDDAASPSPRGTSAGVDLPLLEPMLAALVKSPEKLDRVAALISDLEKTPAGRAIVPEDFHAAWGPIAEVLHGERR